MRLVPVTLSFMNYVNHEINHLLKANCEVVEL